MKFKDKDGNIIGDIYDVVADYCFSKRCEDVHCPLFDVHRGCRTDLAEESPVEFARLMGYEVINDFTHGGWPVADVKKEVNMDNQSTTSQGKPGGKSFKPLKDWTLGEVKELCQRKHCGYCLFNNYGEGYHCFLKDAPSVWDLSDPPRFTEAEVRRASMLRELFPDAEEIERGASVIHVRGNHRAAYYCTLGAEMFPSLKPIESVSISDILGGGA